MSSSTSVLAVSTSRSDEPDLGLFGPIPRPSKALIEEHRDDVPSASSGGKDVGISNCPSAARHSLRRHLRMEHPPGAWVAVSKAIDDEPDEEDAPDDVLVILPGLAREAAGGLIGIGVGEVRGIARVFYLGLLELELEVG